MYICNMLVMCAEFRTDCLSRKCVNFVINYFIFGKNSHMHIIGVLVTCAKFQTDCLNCKYCNFDINYFIVCKSHMHIFNMLVIHRLQKSHAHLQYACNTCAKFQIDCLSRKCCNLVIIILLSAKRHMQIFSMLVIRVQSFQIV